MEWVFLPCSSRMHYQEWLRIRVYQINETRMRAHRFSSKISRIETPILMCRINVVV
jgi:hypothetical protein